MEAAAVLLIHMDKNQVGNIRPSIRLKPQTTHNKMLNIHYTGTRWVASGPASG